MNPDDILWWSMAEHCMGRAGSVLRLLHDIMCRNAWKHLIPLTRGFDESVPYRRGGGEGETGKGLLSDVLQLHCVPPSGIIILMNETEVRVRGD